MAVVGGSEFSEAVEQSMIDSAWVIYLVIGSAAALAAISVINTMAMSIGERRREFAQLRLIGATRRQVLAMTAGEAMIVVLIGSVIGVGIGVLSVLGISTGLTGDAGALTVPLPPIAGILAIGLLITLTSQLVPATRVLAGDPLREAGTRE